MAIKIGSSEISDIQVNLNGVVTHVKIVKIGGSSTNIWERTGPWNSGVWIDDYYSSSRLTWNGSVFEGEVYGNTANMYYDDNVGYWCMELDGEYGYIQALKTATEVFFDSFSCGYLRYNWSAS